MEESEAGRDFILVRNEVQDDQDDGGITLAEWTSIVNSDPTLKTIDFTWGRNPKTGERLKVALQGGVIWVAGPNEMDLPIYWNNGQVVCQALDEATTAKVKELASVLQAQCIEITP